MLRFQKVQKGYFVLKRTDHGWVKIDYFEFKYKDEMESQYPQATYEPVEPYLIGALVK